MSYIPSRAMHRAAPAGHASPPVPLPLPASGPFRKLADRLSPRAWTAVAIVAGVVATGVAASAVVDVLDRG